MNNYDLSKILSEAIAVQQRSHSPTTAALSAVDHAPTAEDKITVSEAENSALKKNEEVRREKRTWKKPKGKPKRPLSAYNLFFQTERENILRSTPDPSVPVIPKRIRKGRNVHGKIGFVTLAKQIGAKWKTLSPSSRQKFGDAAKIERQRYDEEMDKWQQDREAQVKGQIESNTRRDSSSSPNPTKDSRSTPAKTKNVLSHVDELLPTDASVSECFEPINFRKEPDAHLMDWSCTVNTPSAPPSLCSLQCWTNGFSEKEMKSVSSSDATTLIDIKYGLEELDDSAFSSDFQDFLTAFECE